MYNLSFIVKTLSFFLFCPKPPADKFLQRSAEPERLNGSKFLGFYQITPLASKNLYSRKQPIVE